MSFVPHSDTDSLFCLSQAREQLMFAAMLAGTAMGNAGTHLPRMSFVVAVWLVSSFSCVSQSLSVCCIIACGFVLFLGLSGFVVRPFTRTLYPSFRCVLSSYYGSADGMSYPVSGMVRAWRPSLGYPGTNPIIPHGMSVILNAPAVCLYCFFVPVLLSNNIMCLISLMMACLFCLSCVVG